MAPPPRGARLLSFLYGTLANFVRVRKTSNKAVIMKCVCVMKEISTPPSYSCLYQRSKFTAVSRLSFLSCIFQDPAITLPWTLRVFASLHPGHPRSSPSSQLAYMHVCVHRARASQRASAAAALSSAVNTQRLRLFRAHTSCHAEARAACRRGRGRAASPRAPRAGIGHPRRRSAPRSSPWRGSRTPAQTPSDRQQ